MNPLTDGMWSCLKAVCERDIPQYGQTTGDKSRFRALMDRGFVTCCVHEGKQMWRATEKGQQARRSIR